MPYKPTRVRCTACGTWIVEVDGREQVVRSNKKVIKREHREAIATVTDDGIELGPDLFLFPDAPHRLITVYVCACRGGRYQVLSTFAAERSDTL